MIITRRAEFVLTLVGVVAGIAAFGSIVLLMYLAYTY